MQARRTMLVVALATASLVGPAAADSIAIDFEGLTPGSIDGQAGWSSSGPYDHEVATQALYPAMGNEVLRISNAVTSGSFGDHTISPSLAQAAGETAARHDGLSAPASSDYFAASFTFASARPDQYQPDLFFQVSPDRGDGARMSYVGFADQAAGLEVIFYDYQVGSGGPDVCDGSFVLSTVATGLDRTMPHTVEIEMQLPDGPTNDVVTVTVDGTATHVGTSWEDFFRGCQPPESRTVDSLIFLTRSPDHRSHPHLAGFGFFVDDVWMSSDAPIRDPQTAEDCKDGGWQSFGFRNQGQCVRYVETGKDSRDG